MRQNKLRFVSSFLVAAALCAPIAARAQAPPDGGPRRGGGQGGGQFANMPRVMGEVTGVDGTKLTIKQQDGSSVSIVTTDNTRIMKGRGNMIKATDIKVGDGVMAAGNLDAPNKTLHAVVIMAQDAAEVKKERENLGKTNILGKVTAVDVDNATMTVMRPDGVSQTIGFDESTSFRRGGRGRGAAGGDAAPAAPVAGAESLTLADIKVGDNVFGPGSIKNGVFVPTVLTVGGQGMGMGQGMGQGRRRGAETTPPATPDPASK